MVNEELRKAGIVYRCEFCGFGYSELDIAERCEEFCGTHGTCSQELTEQALLKPSVRIIPISA